MQGTHLNLLKVVAACLVLSLGDRALASGVLCRIVVGTFSCAELVDEPVLDPVTGLLITGIDGALQQALIRVDGTCVVTTPSETTHSATLTVNGTRPSSVVVEPDPAPFSAPLLLILHVNGGSHA